MTDTARHDESGSVHEHRGRVRLFVAICVAAALVVAGYAVSVVLQRSILTTHGVPAATLNAPPARPYLVVSSAVPGATWGRVVLVSAAASDSARFVTPLACERVHMAGGRGACLTQDRATSTYALEIFDETFTVRHRVALTGVPSRTRVSPDGRWAAATVFEHGHSYAEDGFSTRTTITDTGSGRIHADLEQFDVERDGRPFKAVDFNFWGVTFASDSDTFYATLSSGGIDYLVEGRLRARRARVIRVGVECPSLSPDGSHIVYKHQVDQGAWRLHLYDLASGADRALSSETRSIDDQVDWLDEGHVMYQRVGPTGASVWSLDTTGTTAPQMLVDGAFSPSIVR